MIKFQVGDEVLVEIRYRWVRRTPAIGRIINIEANGDFIVRVVHNDVDLVDKVTNPEAMLPATPLVKALYG